MTGFAASNYADHQAAYHHRGWTVLPQALPPDEADRLAEEAFELFTGRGPDVRLDSEGTGRKEAFDEGGAYRHLLLDGLTVRASLPELWGFYLALPLAAAPIVCRDIVLSPYPRSAVNVKLTRHPAGPRAGTGTRTRSRRSSTSPTTPIRPSSRTCSVSRRRSSTAPETCCSCKGAAAVTTSRACPRALRLESRCRSTSTTQTTPGARTGSTTSSTAPGAPKLRLRNSRPAGAYELQHVDTTRLSRLKQPARARAHQQ
jgi:hypothetical protein